MTSYKLIVVITLSLFGFISGDDDTTTPQPPDPVQAAEMARYVMHYSDWVSIATISTQSNITGFPYVGLKSLSDGPLGNSTGIPYLYMTDMDVSGHDLQANDNVAIMATLAQSEYCEQQDYDPQDPRCAKVIISGKYVKVNESSTEYDFGEACLFSRHPAMKDWPTDHEFYVAKIDPIQIDVLDFFGGIKRVSKEDYFNVTVTKIINASVQSDRVSVVRV